MAHIPVCEFLTRVYDEAFCCSGTPLSRYGPAATVPGKGFRDTTEIRSVTHFDASVISCSSVACQDPFLEGAAASRRPDAGSRPPSPHGAFPVISSLVGAGEAVEDAAAVSLAADCSLACEGRRAAAGPSSPSCPSSVSPLP